MKEKADLVRGYLRKAGGDCLAMQASLTAGAMDAACFHAQQAAEKYLKAFLTEWSVDFPFSHNLAKLVELCATLDPAFKSLHSLVVPLTPYAVELRYDADFWPTAESAQEAIASALSVKDFILSRLPSGPEDNQAG